MKTAFLFELRRDRGLIVAITAMAVVYAGVMAWFWPIMRDNSALIEQYMNVFPPGLMAAFGMEGSLADPGVFYTTYIGSMLWPVLAALVGIVLATRPVAVDLERGFLELPITTALSRGRYLGAVIAAQACALAVLAFATVLSFWVAATIAGAPYEFARVIVLALLAWALACAICASAAILSVVTLSRAVAGGIVAAALLGMYLLNVVAQMTPDLGGLADLSVFHYLRTTPLIDRGDLPVVELSLFALISVVGWGLAVWAFRRRNLAP